MSKLLHWILLGVFGVTLAIVAAAVMGWKSLQSPMTVPDPGEWLIVTPGTPLIGLAEELSERSIIDAPRLLSIYGRLSGEATRIHAGEYFIQPLTTPRQLLEQLVSGDVYLHQLTVVEGWGFQEFLTALREHEAIDSNGLDADAVMEALGKPQLHPEGQFYPDTYRFARDAPALDILRQAHEAMQEQLQARWSSYRATSVLQNPYEVLILASIVEKETGLAEERQRIAGVFHRRLERGMRLQTDPTVIYGLGSEFDGNLRGRDLTSDTPYNTYTRAGLPPTPIALPGGAALSAAVDPAPGSEIYFVATGRGDGRHYFSSTLEEHNAAVAQHLQELRAPAPQNDQP